VIIDEIKEILEKNGFDTNPETISRVEIMLESIRDDNQLHKLDYIIDWFEKKREQSDMVVEQVGINDLDKYSKNYDFDNTSGMQQLMKISERKRDKFSVLNKVYGQ